MNELLSTIFILFGYKNIAVPKKIESEETDKNQNLLEQFTSQLYSSNSIQDHWLIYNGSPDDLMKKGKQAELLEGCRLICNDKELDKNLNLLCLWPVKQFSDNDFKAAHFVEEDMFFFKKYVLHYQEAELKNLQNKIEEKGTEFIFRKLPLEPEFFTEYKKNSPNNEGSLLYRICIKLTFITLHQDNTEQLTNLKKTIETAVQNKDLLDFDHFIEHTEEVEEKEPDELLVLLNEAMSSNE